MIPQVYVDGMNLAALAPVSDLVIAHEFPAPGVGGPVTADFTLLLAPNQRPGWLVKDAPAEVRFGPGLPMLAGTLSEPDWTDGSITINAASTEGDSTVCMAADESTTSSTPDVVLDAAKARGALTWTRPASISTTPLMDGDQPADLNSVSDMLGAYCDANTNTRVYVDAYRQILKTTDPVTPELFILPGAGELAWTSEAQATRVVGRWADKNGGLHTTMVGSGAIEQLVDLTVKGPLTAASATVLLNSVLARATSGGWANGLTLAAEQFVGAPHLAAVADMVGKGVMVRILGQRDPRPNRIPVGYVDVIVERSEWHVADSQIILTPRGMVARDWTAILADVGLSEAA